jgi:sulfatase-like protein
MPGEPIIVFAVDGLRASALGAYGNTSFSTQALDGLAAESLVFDACCGDSTDLALIYRAMWQSLHPLRRATVDGDADTLPQLLGYQGYATTLITDDAAVVAQPLASRFDECVQIAGSPPTRAAEISETALARLFAAACEQVTSVSKPQLVWIHARGMYGPWDAPLYLQEPLLEMEEGDPEPCDALEPPEIADDRALDPDEALRWNCGYAAQVVALDACLEGTREYLREAGLWDRCTFLLCGVRGFPLGEHGRIGGVDDRLYGEQLHVPLIVRRADGTDRLARSEKLISHIDLMPTLLGSVATNRDALIAASSSGTRAIRTADWCLRCEPTVSTDADDEQKCELYVRPDDRWEANDVAALCPDVVQELSQQLEHAAAELQRSDVPQSPPTC